MQKSCPQTVRTFVLSLIKDTPNGKLLTDILDAAKDAHLSSRVVKHVIHDEEYFGRIERDFDRRYRLSDGPFPSSRK